MTQALHLQAPNFAHPSADICTCGRPSADDLKAAQAKGIRKVINLCPISEDPGYDEAALVAELGMAYENIPVAGPGDLNRDNAQKLATALANADGVSLVHCASSNRVGALFALKAHYLDGANVEDALAHGREHGLRAMEPTVRQILGA